MINRNLNFDSETAQRNMLFNFNYGEFPRAPGLKMNSVISVIIRQAGASRTRKLSGSVIVFSIHVLNAFFLTNLLVHQ